jgi:hypothetical protein
MVKCGQQSEQVVIFGMEGIYTEMVSSLGEQLYKNDINNCRHHFFQDDKHSRITPGPSIP